MKLVPEKGCRKEEHNFQYLSVSVFKNYQTFNQHFMNHFMETVRNNLSKVATKSLDTTSPPRGKNLRHCEQNGDTDLSKLLLSPLSPDNFGSVSLKCWASFYVFFFVTWFFKEIQTSLFKPLDLKIWPFLKQEERPFRVALSWEVQQESIFRATERYTRGWYLDYVESSK